MSSIKPFNNSNWLKQIDNTTDIDYFFTQRKVTETVEYLEDNTLERKKKKETVTHNFLAINLPIIKEEFNKIKVELWGDKSYNYEGEIISNKGICPNLMLKLNEDTQMFIKLIYSNENNDVKTYIHFIPILKRYQK